MRLTQLLSVVGLLVASVIAAPTGVDGPSGFSGNFNAATASLDDFLKHAGDVTRFGLPKEGTCTPDKLIVRKEW